MAELKKCPFCGGEAELVEQKHREYASTHYVKCKICNCKTIERPAVNKIIDAWNNRSTEEELRAAVINEFAERLNAKIEKVHSAPEKESAYNHAWKTVCRIIQSNLETIAEQMKGEKE